MFIYVSVLFPYWDPTTSAAESIWPYTCITMTLHMVSWVETVVSDDLPTHQADYAGWGCWSTSHRIEMWFCFTSIVALTHWGRVVHICVGNLTIIGSNIGLSPGRHQAIIWTNAGIFSIWLLGTNFSEISIKIETFHSMKCIWKCRLENGGHFVLASMC